MAPQSEQRGIAGPAGQFPLIALTVAIAVSIALIFSLYSLVPVTRPEDPALASLFVGTMMTFVMLVQVFTPALVRRFSLRWVVVGSTLLLAIGAGLTGFAPDALLLVGAVTGGVGFGFVIVAGAQGVALLVPPERLGRALGRYGLITMAASAVGSAAGVQLAVSFSDAVFGVVALMLGVVGAGFGLGIPAGVGQEHEHRRRGSEGDAVDARSDVGAPGVERPGAEWPGVERSSADRRQGGWRGMFSRVPWLVMTLLLLAVVLLSHGLTSLPVSVVAFGTAALVVFAAQAGNAIGRAVGGELESAFGPALALGVGTALLTVGGVLGVLALGTTPALTSGALIGLGIGIVQTVTLHAAMQRMDAGSASVVWNLAVDGGFWVGGIMWGLALTAGLVMPSVLVLVVALVGVGVAVVWRLRRAGSR